MTGTKSKRNRQRDGIRPGGATPHLGRQVVRVPPDGWLVILFLLDDTPVRSPRQRRRGTTFLADLIVGRSSPFHWLADDGKTKELGTQVGAFVRPLSEPAMATIQKCTFLFLGTSRNVPGPGWLSLAQVHFTFKQQRQKQKAMVPMILTPAGTYDFWTKNAGICEKLQQVHHLLVTAKQQEDAKKKWKHHTKIMLG